MSYDPDYRTSYIQSKSPFFSAYSLKIQTPLTFPENSPHTRQEFKAESDINTIMAQYMRTGELPQINLLAPQFLDCGGESFADHMNYIAGANSLFNELPSAIRNRFQNDPGAFIDFCSNPNNRPELAQMGLLSTQAIKAMRTHTPAPSASPASSQEPAPQNQQEPPASA
jgi:phage internal scaffolding protein